MAREHEHKSHPTIQFGHVEWLGVGASEMKAFLSSTFMDLKKHRAAVADAIEGLGIELSRMETFGARPDEPRHACLDEIDGTDLFIGIYAHRYGFVPANASISITETEFDYATKLHRPTFCFVVDEKYQWHESLKESEPGRAKLNAFKAKINSLVVRDVFTTPEVLATRVATSVGRYLIADPRKSDSLAVDEFARKSIADGATAVFVDVMRLACVSGSPVARTVNEPRYGEFVDIADQHLSEFRGQIARLSTERGSDFPNRCAEVENRLAWAIMRLRGSTVLGTPWREFAVVLRTLGDKVAALAVSAAQDYYAARTSEAASVVNEVGDSTLLRDTLKDPDVFVHRRFAMQSAIIKSLQASAALAISTVRDDMDRLLAIPYFTIDHHLLRIVAESEG